MIKLLMADDHAIVREGMKQLFALTEDITVEKEAEDGEQVLACIQQDSFDVLLMDMSMPGLSGVNLISRVHALHPELPIIILTMHNEPQIARRAINAGVSGYLTKDCDPGILLSAIRRVYKGGRFFDPILAEQMVFESSSSEQKLPHHSLSKREFQIFQLLAKGMGINEIAAELDISNKTVSTHKMRLMQKMGFQSNADVIRYAIEHDFIE